MKFECSWKLLHCFFQVVTGDGVGLTTVLNPGEDSAIGKLLCERILKSIIHCVTIRLKSCVGKDVVFFQSIFSPHVLAEGNTRPKTNGITALEVPSHQAEQWVPDIASYKLILCNLQFSFLTDNGQQLVKRIF